MEHIHLIENKDEEEEETEDRRVECPADKGIKEAKAHGILSRL